MYCLETQDLSYRFSKSEMILNKINLQVLNGSIYGFLGPNGAGKTTTLRLILGLLKNQAGNIKIFGKSFEKERINILKKVGSLIESPSLYSQLTAFENLLVLQKLYQCPKTRIDEVLQLVGLGETKNKKAGQFSLGMKQRLSIAMALLHSPELLILDEPTNGLDPNGIIEIRSLLKHLNDAEGITIIISSHLLSEIEKLVTHVGLIHKGTLIFQDTLESLMNKQNMASVTLLQTNNNEAALKICKQLNLTAHEQLDKIFLPVLPKENKALLVKSLVENGLELYELTLLKNDLESVFIELTK